MYISGYGVEEYFLGGGIDRFYGTPNQTNDELRLVCAPASMMILIPTIKCLAIKLEYTFKLQAYCVKHT